MFFRQIYEPGLAHASYMVGCQATGTVMVIDAKRDIDTYLEIAKQERLTITHVAETHIHADFLSGSREIAEATGAMLYLSDEGGDEWKYEFDHVGLKDGDTFMVGNIKVDVVHTPGHTPEHISFLVTDTPAIADVPIMMFTGDFVFVGDVGRPDLLERAAGYVGTMEVGARQLWKSLEKFRQLPDHIQVHPAHGAGSACGKALGAIPSSTVGYEKLVNWALRHTNEDAFVQELLMGQPEPPRYFAQMKRLNKVPRPLAVHMPQPRLLSMSEVRDALESRRLVLDTRNKMAFAGGHLQGSINIQNNKAFSTWTGWLVDYDVPYVVIAEQSQLDDVVRKLLRIGLDNIAGWYPNVTDFADQGVDLQTTTQIDTEALASRLGEEGLTVIDVRGIGEHEAGHIPGSWNIHGGYLREHLGEIPRTGTVVITCQGGDRSAIASSLLLREGFTNIINHSQGYVGWKAHAKAVEFTTN